MPHTLLYVHLVWTTSKRIKFLYSSEIRKIVFQHIYKYCKSIGVNCITVNGYSDHVHMLLQMSPTDSISRIVKIVKGESSTWINKNNVIKPPFKWQNGYYAESVSKHHVKTIQNYILNQEQHHGEDSFAEELLEKYYQEH